MRVPPPPCRAQPTSGNRRPSIGQPLSLEDHMEFSIKHRKTMFAFFSGLCMLNLIRGHLFMATLCGLAALTMGLLLLDPQSRY